MVAPPLDPQDPNDGIARRCGHVCHVAAHLQPQYVGQNGMCVCVHLGHSESVLVPQGDR